MAFRFDNNTITLYHYTNGNGFRGIIRNRRINKSMHNARRKDVRFGEGVYLTELDPQRTPKEMIALNNWDGMNFANIVNSGKVDYCIEIVFSRNDPNLTDFSDYERSVWLYRDDIDLNLFQVRGGRVS